jgi:hypothetical protein
MKEEAVAWFKKLLGKEAYRRLRRIQPVQMWISTDWDDTVMMSLEYSKYKGGPAKRSRKLFWCERYRRDDEAETLPLPFYLPHVEGSIMRRLVGSYPASVLLELAENWEGELYTAECVKWREESRGVVMGLFEGGQEDLQRLVLEFTGAR